MLLIATTEQLNIFESPSVRKFRWAKRFKRLSSRAKNETKPAVVAASKPTKPFDESIQSISLINSFQNSVLSATKANFRHHRVWERFNCEPDWCAPYKTALEKRGVPLYCKWITSGDTLNSNRWQRIVSETVIPAEQRSEAFRRKLFSTPFYRYPNLNEGRLLKKLATPTEPLWLN